VISLADIRPKNVVDSFLNGSAWSRGGQSRKVSSAFSLVSFSQSSYIKLSLVRYVQWSALLFLKYLSNTLLVLRVIFYVWIVPWLLISHSVDLRNDLASSHDFAANTRIHSRGMAPGHVWATHSFHYPWPLFTPSPFLTSRVLAHGRLIDLIVGIQHEIGFKRLALGSVAFYRSIAQSHVRNPASTKGSEERTEHPAEVLPQA